MCGESSHPQDSPRESHKELWVGDAATHRKGVLVYITIIRCTHEHRGRILNIFHIDGDRGGG